MIQLLGHSMGASPVISAAPILQSRGYKVVGVVVLDVVEGEQKASEAGCMSSAKLSLLRIQGPLLNLCP
jgi:thioesterase domain-containing protein